MKRLILFVFSLLIINIVSGQTQKTFVKSFNMNGDNFLVLELEGEVEVKEWSEPFMRVHTNVSLENASTVVLKSLLMQGRYNLTPSLQNGSLLISSGARPVNIKYRGQALVESVSYTVFVPAYVEVEIIDKGAEAASVIHGDAEVRN